MSKENQDFSAYYDYDGRLSQSNKEWAKTIEIPKKRDERDILGNLDGVHMTVVDGFANRVRESEHIVHQKDLIGKKFHLTGEGNGSQMYMILGVNTNGSVHVEHGIRMKTLAKT
jgi:hypothetical protein